MPVFLRQQVHRRAQTRFRLHLCQRVRRQGVRVGKVRQLLFAGFNGGGGQRAQRHGAGAAPPIQLLITVQQNRVKPGRKTAAPIEARNASPRLNHRLRSKVLGRGVIAAQRDGLLEKPPLVRLRQRAKGLGIPFARTLKEFPRRRFTELSVRMCHLSLSPRRGGNGSKNVCRSVRSPGARASCVLAKPGPHPDDAPAFASAGLPVARADLKPMNAPSLVQRAQRLGRGPHSFLLMTTLIATAADSSLSPTPSAEPMTLVREVLRTVPLIDGHNDMPWQFRAFRNDLAAVNLRTGTDKLAEPWVTDIPRLRAGGVGGQFWAVYVPPKLPAAEAVQMTLEQIDLVHRFTGHYADTFELARTAEDVERIHRAGKIASLIGIEGGHSLGNSLAVLRMCHGLGARYLTLTHTKNTAWADAAGDSPQHGGLTPFGEAVVRELNRLGMMVDLSHVSDDTMRAALRASRAPVIFSHSSARAICDHERNVPDAILRETARKGGLVMVCFLPGYVTNEARDEFRAAMAEKAHLAALYPDDPKKAAAEMGAWRRTRPNQAAPTVRDVADHVDHLRTVMGVDHVGIGSDFDGFTGTLRGLEDVSKFPALLAELARRGYGKPELQKIAGLNLLRVMREVEAVSHSLRDESPSQACP